MNISFSKRCEEAIWQDNDFKKKYLRKEMFQVQVPSSQKAETEPLGEEEMGREENWALRENH